MSFFDGGNKSLSFGEKNDNTWLGKWQGGVILNISDPQTSMSFMDKSKPKTYDNGDVVKKIVVSLDTRSGKCPAPMLDEEDDGVRDWHIDKGYGQSKAVAAALRTAKLKDIEVGGSIYVRWISGEGKVGDPRNFEAIVEPPVQGSGGMFEEPAQPSFPNQVVPAQQPPAASLPGTSFPPQVSPGQAPANPYAAAAPAQVTPEAAVLQAISMATTPADIAKIWTETTARGVAWSPLLATAADSRIAAMNQPPAQQLVTNPYAQR